jgi:hypothetical protein
MVLLVLHGYFFVASGLPWTLPEGLNTFPSVAVGTAVGAAIGALLATRHPSNPVGWLFCAGMLGTAVGLAADAYVTAVHRFDYVGWPWLTEPIVVASATFGAVWAFSLLGAVLLLFPDGRLTSRGERLIARLLPVPVAVTTLALLYVAVSRDIDLSQPEPDLGPAVVVPVVGSAALLAVLLVAVAISLVRRLRAATGLLHQQLRCVATASIFLVASLIVALVAQVATGGEKSPVLFEVALFLSFAAVPAAAGIAVLRYRLYDIDVVISRAIMLGVLLIFVTAGYVGAVVASGAVLGDRAHAPFWPSWLATATVALAFQPLRRRVGRLADRLLYGPRAAPYEALADLTRRLSDSPDTDEVLPEIAHAAAVAVGARSAVVRLVVPGGGDVVASWPVDAPALGGEEVTVDVVERDERLGSIAVQLPPGHRLRPTEQALLADLANQSAMAMRNAQLTAELTERVAELDATTAELRESRRRLVDARDAEQSRLEAAIRRDVLEHVIELPELIEQTADRLAATLDHPNAPRPSVATMAEAVDRALAQLRVVTRGVFPTQLARSGVVPALSAHIGRLRAATLRVEGDAAERFAPRVEAAVYFCVAELAGQLSGPVSVLVSSEGGTLRAVVTGTGTTSPTLANLRDRIDSVGGTIEVRYVDRATVVELAVPTRVRITEQRRPTAARAQLPG